MALLPVAERFRADLATDAGVSLPAPGSLRRDGRFDHLTIGGVDGARRPGPAGRRGGSDVRAP